MTKLWKLNKKPVPHHVVQMLIVDPEGRLFLIHRSNNVKSARNVWSIPTGTHDIGETIGETIRREAFEEFGFNVVAYELVGQYENIAGDFENPDAEQFHWVLSLYAVLVQDVRVHVNKEPELHDQIAIVPIEDIREDNFLQTFKFHPSLQEWFQNNGSQAANQLSRFISPF